MQGLFILFPFPFTKKTKINKEKKQKQITYNEHVYQENLNNMYEDKIRPIVFPNYPN